MKNKFFLLAGFVLVFYSCANDKKDIIIPNCDLSDVSYSGAIQTIIGNSCAFSGCHVSGNTFGDFNDYNQLKHRIDNGTFQNYVFKQKSMPPSFSPGSQLSDCDLAKLQAWIDEQYPDN